MSRYIYIVRQEWQPEGRREEAAYYGENAARYDYHRRYAQLLDEGWREVATGRAWAALERRGEWVTAGQLWERGAESCALWLLRREEGEP